MRRVLVDDHQAPDRPPLAITPARSWRWWRGDHRLVCDGRTGYDTTELTVAAGTAVDVLVNDDESGWSWCRSAEGIEGWIPNRVLSAG